MTRKRLNRIWQALAAARRTLPKLADLEDLARMCGREPYAGGKHVMWISAAFPTHRAFPIPRHGKNPTASYTVRDSVLDHLEADLAAWEEVVEAVEEQDELDDQEEQETEDDTGERGSGDDNGTG